ncbi:S-layer family protein [Paenibacillus taihuensis]|uniref:S-layer family protein n=1 Tax=Paenibacillus taihuensis TaxID=1156355 RepID=A0A3D9RYQ1_9BACL|nr:S-layer family protein [Paenibacillus taihuensis]
MPEGVDPSKITTGVVVEPDGIVRHVPTRVEQRDGKYYAIINSLTNSTYSVVWHPLTFSDVSNHWAKQAVNDMGSRMVINGTGEDQFSPNDNISRAEFAAILVRGLGLRLENGASGFVDVKESDWYNDAVKTAAACQLVQGFEDGMFRPNGTITREQAMTMIARAMKITGLTDQLADQNIVDTLHGYKDVEAVSDWSASSVAACVQASVVTGKPGQLLALDQFITRAEAAAIMERLLHKSGLI